MLIAEYLSRTVPTGAPDPCPGEGAGRHFYGNVREYTSSIDLDHRAGYIKGRCWADTINSTHTLAGEWTHPIGTHSFKHGFRCAKSAAPPAAIPPLEKDAKP